MKLYDETVRHDIKPSYYGGKLDVIDFLYAIFGKAADLFMVGNIIKYVVRYPKKNGLEDLLKARTYLNRLIERTEANDSDD
ncbi:DUF3310 domain-containing protein [Lacticaseibacillus nasuensis]|nr:DUF3310 domain-containing protein [Lacticaseibacillus nasuensis]